MAVLKINGIDFSDCVPVDGGIKPKHTDLESDNSGRNYLSGLMYRNRITTKVTVSVKCVMLPQSRLQVLRSAVRGQYFTMEFTDFETGRYSGTFYSTDFEASLYGEINGVTYWKDATFTCTEQ